MAVGLMLAVVATGACAGNAQGSTGGNAPGSNSAFLPAQTGGVAQVATAYPVQPGYGQGINVTGVGVVHATPDMAVLSLGVEGDAATVVDARQIAAQAMDGTIKVLHDNGVQDQDIQTSYFNIQPQYTYEQVTQNGIQTQRQRITGYRVTNTLTVKVHDLTSLGTIIDGAVQAGGDATRVNNISFTFSNASDLEQQARVLALQDALAKADTYAKALGATRGKLAYVAETSAPQYPKTALPMAAGAAAPEASTVIMPGQSDIQVTVQAVFNIQ